MKKILTIVCVVIAAYGVAAQERIPFNGLIINSAGKGVKAKFQVQGTNLVSFSDKYGRFGFMNMQPEDTLLVHFLREEHKIGVGGRRSLRIVVDGETVVSADADAALVAAGEEYVHQRERIMGGTVIYGEDLRRSGFNTLTSALTNHVPGMTVLPSGQVQFRVGGSINSPTYALILFDGHETASLSDINLYDVGTVEILKETPLYGFRGGNGVVVVKSRAYEGKR